MQENDAKTYPKGLTRQKRGFSLVWIVPIVAMIITVGMIYKSYIDQGTRIYITIEDGSGIMDGKTPLMYKGIKIGAVEDVRIKEDDVSMLELTVVVDKASSGAVAREGNKFWKVQPKVSLTEVSGLDTLIKGVYIAVMPAATTKEKLLELPYQENFIALDRAPIDVFRPGLSISVNTQNKGDISIGAPVLYNKQTIGRVEEKKLSTDQLSVDLYLRIEDAYTDLIHESSIFYKIDALEVKADLSSVKINMGSLSSFITGGIGIHNEKEALESALVKEFKTYSLYDNFDEIMLSKDDISLTMRDHYQLTADISKLYYKGVEAGIVKNIKYDPVKNETKIKAKLHNDFRAFANEKSYFWIVKPEVSFDGIEGIDTVVRGNYINFVSSDIKAKEKSDFILHGNKPRPEGIKLRLISENMQGLKEGAGLFYHDIEIGVLNAYRLNKDNSTFTIDYIVEPKYAHLLNASSSFYHNSGVSFEASLQKVSIDSGSLESVVRGGVAVETFDFKTAGKLKKEYKLHKDSDAMVKARYLAAEGLYLTLVASKAGSLKKGSPIFYKQIKVGEVLSSKWDSKNQKVLLKAFVIEEYAKEVHANTLFYNASGIDAKLDLNGLRIDTQSIETIVSGGISFFTPLVHTDKVVKKNEHFSLFDSKDEAMNTYFNIRLFMDDSSGLKVGSSLKYKNVVIGYVEAIDLLDKKVVLDLHIDSKYKSLVNSESIFWLEGFEFGLKGVKNASAALTGPSIIVLPGKSKQMQTEFDLNTVAPEPHFNEKGLRLTLDAPRLGNIKPGTPIYFRQIEIGSVINFSLNDKATGVKIEVFIEDKFSYLIHQNSYFYNASGIGMDMSLFGAKVKTETIESIVTGGIGVLTPDDYTGIAQEKDMFILHESFDENALKWAPELTSELKI